MLKIVLSEIQKLKGTFCRKLIYIVPLSLLLLWAVLGVGEDYQIGAYNWWYATFFPILLTIVSSTIVEKDKKLKYLGLYTLPYSKTKLWFGKIIAAAYMCLISSLIFGIGIVIVGNVYVEKISFYQNCIALVILFVTFLWQIPFCMLLASKFGMTTTTLINIFCNYFGGIVFAAESNWYIWPSSIQVRLMCPILEIHPNGLPISAVNGADSLLNSNVIVPGLLISISMIIIMAIITTLYFKHKAEK